MKWKVLIAGLAANAKSKLEGGEKHPAWSILGEIVNHVELWQDLVEREIPLPGAAPAPLPQDGDLLPCPFCGSKCITYGASLVRCEDIDCAGGMVWTPKTWWNRRARPSPIREADAYYRGMAHGKQIAAKDIQEFLTELDNVHTESPKVLGRVRGGLITIMRDLEQEAGGESPKEVRREPPSPMVGTDLLDKLCDAVKHWAQNGMQAEHLEPVEWLRNRLLAILGSETQGSGGDVDLEALAKELVAVAGFAMAMGGSRAEPISWDTMPEPAREQWRKNAAGVLARLRSHPPSGGQA